MREEIANKYLHGSGIEIGALHNPLKISTDINVKYVDRMSTTDLRKQYPELNELPIVEVDIIDDGETLNSISDESFDFVIANHFIEHCQNPIGTIKQMLRVIKRNGIIYMAVPIKTYTFDKDREITSLDHLQNDYVNGPNESKKDHFIEWSKLVDKISDDKIAAHVDFLMNIDYSIHFHVWDATSFNEFLNMCQTEIKLPFIIVTSFTNGSELICCLLKK